MDKKFVSGALLGDAQYIKPREHHTNISPFRLSIMPVIAFPEFPTNVPTHPLVVVDYELLKNGDTREADKLWNAATLLGFW
jgi:hypothetical protein